MFATYRTVANSLYIFYLQLSQNYIEMRETFDCHWKEVYVGGAEHSVVCNYSLIRDGFF
jgi:hypothetical protein